MNKLIILLLLTLGVIQSQTPSTQVDYNRQIRNTPTSYTAIPGTGTLAAAINNTPTGGTLIIPAGTFIVTSTINVTKSIAIQCQPGATINAGANNIYLFLLTAAFSLDKCTLDGRYSQSGFTGTVAVRSGGGTYALILNNNTIQNFPDSGVIVGHSGVFKSAYNQFLNFGTGTITDNAMIYQSGGTVPSYFSSDHDIFNIHTSGNAIHMFTPNNGVGSLSINEAIHIDSPTISGIDRISIEGSTCDAQSVQILNPVINKSSLGQFGISWQTACGVIGTDDNDAPIEITGGSLMAYPGNAYGHGLAMEIFARRLIVTGTHIGGLSSDYAWAVGINASGGLQMTNSVIDHTVNAITQNLTVPALPWLISNSKFVENCLTDIQYGSIPSLTVTGSLFMRTPGTCAAVDFPVAPCGGNRCYIGILSDSDKNGDIVSGNKFVFGNVAASTFFTAAAIATGASAPGDRFDHNEFTNLFSAPFGVAYSVVGTTFAGNQITNNIFNNIAQVTDNGNAGQAVRVFNNIDMKGNILSTSNGASFLSNVAILVSSNQISCQAITNGVTVNFSDSSTATFGAAITGGGTNSVTGVCNGSATAASGTYTSGGTVTGTSTQTCGVKFPGGQTAVVALTGTNTIAGGTALSSFTGQFLQAPTTAILQSTGTAASCSGSIVTSVTLNSAIGFTVVAK